MRKVLLYKQINILWLRVDKATSGSFIKNIVKKSTGKKSALLSGGFVYNCGYR